MENTKKIKKIEATMENGKLIGMKENTNKMTLINHIIDTGCPKKK